MKLCLRASLVALLLLPVGSVVLAEELGTAFSYQAQLKQNDVVVNDVCDFAFGLWDAAVDGVQVGATLTFGAGNALSVVDGLVTVSLDFGEGAFGDDVRWLEVSLVCPSGGGLETLDPRQEITATPAALKARGIDGHSLDSADGSVEDAVFVDNFGDVGIGTTTPEYNFHLRTGSGEYGFVHTDGDVAFGSWIDSSGGWFGTRTDHPLHFFTNDSESMMTLDPFGYIGVGTTTPVYSFHLRTTSSDWGFVHTDGDVVFGSWIDDSGGWLGTGTNHPLHFFTNNSNSLMTLDTSGNVGIGTLSPQEKLHVDGGIVTNSGWIGTKDTTPMELYVNNVRAMRFEYAEVDATPAPNFIGGHLGNTVTPGAGGAVVAGGGGDGAVNTVTGDWGTVSGGKGNLAFGARGVVGGGEGNTASGGWSTVSGGQGNMAFGDWSTVSGGLSNTADANRSTVAGGSSNTASGVHSAVGGGELNTASGDHSIVPGGFSNEAVGDYSFAAGRRAKANHNGSFVWADSEPADFASTGNDQFLIRAAGGVGIGTTTPEGNLEVDGGNDGVAVISGFNTSTLFLKRDGGGFDAALSNQGGTAPFVFYGGGATGGTDPNALPELMRLTSAGRVGIGTADPQAQLDVNGTIKGIGIVPLGSIMAHYIDIANADSASAVRAAGFAFCDGTTAQSQGVVSPVITAALPNLNGGKRFLRGANPGSTGVLQIDTTARNGLGLSDPGHTHLTHVTDFCNNHNPGSTPDTIVPKAWWDSNSGCSAGTYPTRSSTSGVSLTAGNTETRPDNMSVAWIMRVK